MRWIWEIRNHPLYHQKVLVGGRFDSDDDALFRFVGYLDVDWRDWALRFCSDDDRQRRIRERAQELVERREMLFGEVDLAERQRERAELSELIADWAR